VIQASNFSRPLWKANLEKDDIDIDMKLDVAPGCFVSGREGEIFEVLVNLIKNAVEAMPHGGTIMVSTKIDKHKIVLEIEDTGDGIAECDLKRMFEPFWTTKGSAGTGLGLVVSQKIISDHGGEISVKSEVGKGTRFKVEIPGVRSLSDESEIPIDAVLERNLKILVIDDSRQIVTLLQEILGGYRQTVLGACSGEEGLDLFNKNEVDVVICDLGMPGMSGWQVGMRVVSSCRERGISKTPFILLTGWGGQSLEQEKLTESGVDGIMEKPVDVRRLFGMIRKVAPDSTARLL
jgi:CheY-like chemotaxis protein